MHPQSAVALLARVTGEVMTEDAMRLALDTEGGGYDPRLAGRLAAYAEKERLGNAFHSDDPSKGAAFR
jgi:hypothetical protein